MSKLFPAGLIKEAKFDVNLRKCFLADQQEPIVQKLWDPDRYFHFDLQGPVPVIHAFQVANFDVAEEPTLYLGQALKWMKSICNRLSQDMRFISFQIRVCFFDRHQSNLGSMHLFTSDVKRQHHIGPPRYTLHRLEDEARGKLDLYHLGTLRLFPLAPGQYFYHYFDDNTEDGYNIGNSDKLLLITIVNEESILHTEEERQGIVQCMDHFLVDSPYRTLVFHYVDYAAGIVGDEFSYMLPTGK